MIDEIGTSEECGAARTIAQRGVQLVATAHGNELENVIKNPALADLVRGPGKAGPWGVPWRNVHVWPVGWRTLCCTVLGGCAL